MNNPFITNGYGGPELFCDREKETALLKKYLTNGNDVVLTAPRRIGKTDLISHLFAQPEIASQYITIKIDIYSTKSFKEMVAILGKAIIEALRPKGKLWISRFLEFATSLRSQLTFDVNGLPVWSLGVGEGLSPEITLDEIFRYLNASEMPCIVAIDEFQQIAKYKDSWTVEALLRTHIQDCHNAHFIFSGSHRHMMAEMFESPARPFYASAITMDLPLLDEKVYGDFCQRLFEMGGRRLNPNVVAQLYKTFGGVTAYMHRLMNVMYSNTPKGEECTPDQIEVAIDEILSIRNDTYTSLRYQLTDKQYSLLRALALAQGATNIQSIDFIRKYHLTTPSSVMSAAKILLDRDLITRQGSTYSVYDRFFELWLRRNP
ncbi:MAG: ATP-binding protein [Bacteroidales bacterium]|nr:ATP-binding protein [Bacteroidales bacterium]